MWFQLLTRWFVLPVVDFATLTPILMIHMTNKTQFSLILCNILHIYKQLILCSTFHKFKRQCLILTTNVCPILFQIAIMMIMWSFGTLWKVFFPSAEDVCKY
jgi:hypothetical protein